MRAARAVVPVFLAFVAAAAASPPPPAGAPGSEPAPAPAPEIVREAKRRFARANQFYAEGRYAEALPLYQAAYDLVPAVNVLFNLGLVREKLFDYEGCAVALRRFLAEAPPSASLRAPATERLAGCRARARVPVHVTSMPPSAAVTVREGDARSPRGRTPARLDLAPGRYTISVEAPGYVPLAQEVAVEEGVHPELDFPLEKLCSLAVEADVAGARARIEGVADGPTPLRRELRAGLYRVTVEKPGHRDAAREVRLLPGEQASLVLALPPLPRENGFSLALERPAPGAVVFVDGESVGAAPVERRLVAGVHHVEVAAPGHLPWAWDARVPDERDLRVTVRLTAQRTPAARAILGGLLGGAAAALVAGGALGGVALDDQRRFDELPSIEARERALGHARTADILFGVSAGLTAAGLGYLLATLPRAPRVTVLR